MMDVTEVKTKAICVKEKMFGGEVTMCKGTLALIVVVCVLAGMVLGLCKGLNVCAGKKECNCGNDDCCQCE